MALWWIRSGHFNFCKPLKELYDSDSLRISLKLGRLQITILWEFNKLLSRSDLIQKSLPNLALKLPNDFLSPLHPQAYLFPVAVKCQPFKVLINKLYHRILFCQPLPLLFRFPELHGTDLFWGTILTDVICNIYIKVLIQKPANLTSTPVVGELKKSLMSELISLWKKMLPSYMIGNAKAWLFLKVKIKSQSMTISLKVVTLSHIQWSALFLSHPRIESLNSKSKKEGVWK